MKHAIIGIVVLSALNCCNQIRKTDGQDSAISEHKATLLNSIIEIDNERIKPVKLSTVLGDTITLSEVVSKMERLFLVITDQCCQECVHKEFERLKHINNSEEIVILMGFQYPRVVYTYIQSYDLGNEVFSIHGKSLFNKPVLLNIPFYFISDCSLRIHHPFYVPTYEPDELTNAYIKKALNSIY